MHVRGGKQRLDGSTGPSLNAQQVTFSTAEGRSRPSLEGEWFPDGFHGTMGELLCAVEEKREPRERGPRRTWKPGAVLCRPGERRVGTSRLRPWSVRRLRDA